MYRRTFLELVATTAGALTTASHAAASAPGRFAAWPGGPDDDAFWALVREQFLLDPAVVYLNTAGLGTCPLPVLNAVSEASRAEERAPSPGHDETMWTGVKEKLARLLGQTCRASDFALIGGATEGINAIVNGLPLRAGDEIVTSTHEHIALNVALLNRARRDGLTVRAFEPDLTRAAGNVERIETLLTPRTRLVFVSHVTCTTGQLMPAAEIAALIRPKGIWFALDGAQAPVCVPVDLAATGADVYTTSTHKWIMGPKRTGFLYVRPNMLDVLAATNAGYAQKYDLRSGELELHPAAQRFEGGTQNDALFAGLGTALDFLHRIGPDRIWRHNRALAERFYRAALRIRDVELVSPVEEGQRSAIIAFRVAGRTHGDVTQALARAHIRARPVSEGGVNAVRVSFHVCNGEADVDRVLEALSKLTG